MQVLKCNQTSMITSNNRSCTTHACKPYDIKNKVWCLTHSQGLPNNYKQYLHKTECGRFNLTHQMIVALAYPYSISEHWHITFQERLGLFHEGT